MSAVPARRRPAEREAADDAEAVPWPRDVSRKPEMKISEVVDRLKTEFPALSLSKVRYLEGEGLVSLTGSATVTGAIPRPMWNGCAMR